MLGIRVRFIESDSAVNLRAQLDVLRLARRRYTNVLVVAHSTAEGVVTGTDDPLMSWADLARLLRTFRPRRLVLIACNAGRWPVARSVFKVIPHLEEVLASPVLASRTFGMQLIGVLPMILLMPIRRTPIIAAALRGAVLIADGGQIRHWTRADLEGGDERGRLLDIAAQLLDPLHRRLSAEYKLLIGRVFPRAKVPVPRRGGLEAASA